MRFSALIMRVVIVAVIFVLGILIGIYGIEASEANVKTNPNQDLTVIFPTNENGETYGSSAHAPTLYEEPDLISALGIDGTIGYVRKTDLDGEEPKTPEEALTLQSRRKDKEYLIPLYEADGKTIIGEFLISNGVEIEHSDKDSE